MPLRSPLVSIACALVALTPVCTRAQTSTEPQVIALSVQASGVPLYGGDATVGRMTGIGPTVRLGAKVIDQMPYVEASYSFLPGSTSSGKPRVQFFSVQGGRWFGTRPKRPSYFLGGGLGLTNYSVPPNAIPACVLPGCPTATGPTFTSRSVTTLIGGAGMTLPLVDGVGLRGDFRMHLPMERPTVPGSSGKLRFELAFGLRLHASSGPAR